jgi:hypothetical protein
MKCILYKNVNAANTPLIGYHIFDIEPFPGVADKYFCTGDPAISPNQVQFDYLGTVATGAYTNYLMSDSNDDTGTLVLPVEDKAFIPLTSIRVELDKGQSKCYYYNAFNSKISYGFFDYRYNICNNDRDVSSVLKVPDMDFKKYKAYIDLGLK